MPQRTSDYTYKARVGLDPDKTFWYQAYHNGTQIAYSDSFKTEDDAKKAATRACRSHRQSMKSRKSRYPLEFFPLA